MTVPGLPQSVAPQVSALADIAAQYWADQAAALGEAVTADQFGRLAAEVGAIVAEERDRPGSWALREGVTFSVDGVPNGHLERALAAAGIALDPGALPEKVTTVVFSDRVELSGAAGRNSLRPGGPVTTPAGYDFGPLESGNPNSFLSRPYLVAVVERLGVTGDELQRMPEGSVRLLSALAQGRRGVQADFEDVAALTARFAVRSAPHVTNSASGHVHGLGREGDTVSASMRRAAERYDAYVPASIAAMDRDATSPNVAWTGYIFERDGNGHLVPAAPTRPVKLDPWF